jgi:hypothetical protein
MSVDNGGRHEWLIHNTYYNKDSPYRLLSLHHRAQVTDDNFLENRGTWCGTYDDAVELSWDQRRYKRTIERMLHCYDPLRDILDFTHSVKR